MPTQPSDVPLDPSARSEGDPVPLLDGASEDAPLASDPSLEAAADELAAPAEEEPAVESPAPVAPAPAAVSPVPRPDDEQELARLRAQVDALLNDPFDEWVDRIQVGGVTASGFEKTLSWRVTKPLRLVRTFQIRVQQLGLPGAVGHTARYAKRRLTGRAR